MIIGLTASSFFLFMIFGWSDLYFGCVVDFVAENTFGCSCSDVHATFIPATIYLLCVHVPSTIGYLFQHAQCCHLLIIMYTYVNIQLAFDDLLNASTTWLLPTREISMTHTSALFP